MSTMDERADERPADIPYPHAGELVNHWWWRPGWSPGTHWYAWHFTLDDQPELQQLAAEYQSALRGFDSLDLIPGRWLHVTVQGIGNAAEVTGEERDRIVRAVEGRLSQVQAPTLTFHRPVLHREAVVIPPTDLQPLRNIRNAVRTGIADVWGQDGVPEPLTYRPHFSIAYANRDESAAAVLKALDAIRPGSASTVLKIISLIDLDRDDDMYVWRAARSVELSSSGSPTSHLRNNPAATSTDTRNSQPYIPSA